MHLRCIYIALTMHSPCTYHAITIHLPCTPRGDAKVTMARDHVEKVGITLNGNCLTTAVDTIVTYLHEAHVILVQETRMAAPMTEVEKSRMANTAVRQ